MSTTQLQIYKRAILLCRQTPITALTDTVESRRLCDVHYDDTLQCIMEGGFWTCALRTIEMTLDTAVDAAFGFDYAHTMPTDFVRWQMVSAYDALTDQLDEMDGGKAFRIEGGYLWATTTPVYMRYVSNDAAYGLDLTKWSERMAEAASLELAARICAKLSGSDSMEDRLREQAARGHRHGQHL